MKLTSWPPSLIHGRAKYESSRAAIPHSPITKPLPGECLSRIGTPPGA